jgi:hypothetical protein
MDGATAGSRFSYGLQAARVSKRVSAPGGTVSFQTHISTSIVKLSFFVAENSRAVWFGPLFMGLRLESEIGSNSLF